MYQLGVPQGQGDSSAPSTTDPLICGFCLVATPSTRGKTVEQSIVTWMFAREFITNKRAGGRTDGRTDGPQYEQTHNVMQVWTGKLSELQLPVQTQPERALAQVCHTRIDALSPDEYQFHLLLHRNSHHSQATYPK